MKLSNQQFDYLKKLSKLSFDSDEEDLIKLKLQEFISFVDVITSFEPEDNKITYNTRVINNPKISYIKPSPTRDITKLNAFIGDYKTSSTNRSITVKDNILVEGMGATAASKMLESYVASYDSDVALKLKTAGFEILGKTNMDEFAMGFDSATGFKGRVFNPLDMRRSAGGSSGGAAVTVASMFSRVSLGSDTGGSIRQPASYMGLVGLKPTYGSVSRFGLIAYASSFDQIGPIGRSVSDCRMVYDVIKDGCDMLENKQPPRILVPQNLLKLCKYPELIWNAAGLIGDGKVEVFDMPYLDELIACYYVIACAECSSNLGRYDDDRYISRDVGFGFEVKKRILLGNYCLSHGFFDEYYKKAMSLRDIISKLMDDLTKDAVIVLPVTKDVAPLIEAGSKGEMGANQVGSSNDGGISIEKYKDDIFTVIANISGNPSITVPCGNGEDGMPFGVQIIAGKNQEDELFSLSARIEDAVGGFWNE